MKTKKVFWLPLLAVVLGAIWFVAGKGSEGDGVRRVEAPLFREIIKDTSVVVIDVRTAGEHRQGAVPGTDFNIDVKSADFEGQALRVIPEGAVVAVYCRSGNRSRKAASILSGKGFRVVELSTGYKGWKEMEQKDR